VWSTSLNGSQHPRLIFDLTMAKLPNKCKDHAGEGEEDCAGEAEGEGEEGHLGEEEADVGEDEGPIVVGGQGDLVVCCSHLPPCRRPGPLMKPRNPLSLAHLRTELPKKKLRKYVASKR